MAERAGKALLRLSLDETSVSTVYTGQRGTVMRCWPGSRKRVDAFMQATRAQMRSAFTHVAIICDNTQVQPLLPQVLVIGERLLTTEEQSKVYARLPPNVFIVRQKKGWSTIKLMVQIVKLVGRALQPYIGTLQPVLSLDCAKVHLHSSVVRACTKSGIWYTVVPAKMTWLLQPCDTHLFAAYKQHLKSSFSDQASQDGPDAVTTTAMIFLLCKTIRQVMQGRSWRTAFDACGCGLTQSSVSQATLATLGWAKVPKLPPCRPSLDGLTHIYPGRFRIPHAALWAPFDAPLDLALAPDNSEEEAAPESVDHEGPGVWHGRLRSTSTLHMEEETDHGASLALVGEVAAEDHAEPLPRAGVAEPWLHPLGATSATPAAGQMRTPLGYRLPGSSRARMLRTPGASSTDPWQPPPARGSTGSQPRSPT